MKKKLFTSVAVMAAITSAMAATAMAEDYKVGIVQYVDDASLNQITENCRWWDYSIEQLAEWTFEGSPK